MDGKNSIINLVSLIAITLTTVFIQINNSTLETYNSQLVFDMLEITHTENLAIGELLTLHIINYKKDNNHTSIISLKSLDEVMNTSISNYKDYVNGNIELGTSIEKRLREPPKWIGLNLSLINKILYIIQIISILVLMAHTIGETKNKT